MKNLFVITYGRTGSTLLMGLINSSNKFNIRGENHNFIEGLALANERLNITKNQWGNDDGVMATEHPWFGANELKNSHEKFADVISSSLGFIDGKINGIKEIRHLHMSQEDFERYMSFINSVFPDSKFIFNFRRFDDVKSSAWWKDFDENELKDQIQQFKNNVDNYIEKNNNGLIVHFEDVVSGNIDELADFIDLNLTSEEVNNVLSKKHSLGNKKHLIMNDDNDLENVLEFRFDSEVFENDKMSFQGVFLSDEKVCSIMLKANGKEYNAIIGINSPRIQSKYIENEYSGSSRFKFIDVPVFSDGVIVVTTDSNKYNKKVQVK